MLKIKTLTIGELSTNCYLVWNTESKEGVIIDPADEANFISEQILGLGITPTVIIATHGHFDHLLAAYELELAFNIPLLIHKNDLFLIKRLTQTAKHFLKRAIIEQPPEKLEFVDEGKEISIGSEKLTVFWTPGHTPGSLALYNQKYKALFSGDTILPEEIGTTERSYSSTIGLLKSLERLSKLPGETMVYPGHGEITTLGEALKT